MTDETLAALMGVLMGLVCTAFVLVFASYGYSLL